VLYGTAARLYTGKVKTGAQHMTLAHYTNRAARMTIAELTYALRDVTDTLAVHRDRDVTDPYVAKLLAEFDAYVVALHKRRDRARAQSESDLNCGAMEHAAWYDTSAELM